MGLHLLMHLLIKVFCHQQTSRSWMETSGSQRRKQHVMIVIEKIKNEGLRTATLSMVIHM